MSKLIMLSGIAGSGKSTKSQQLLESGNYIRVNRDLLRTMLHFDKWNFRNEKKTVNAEKHLVRSFLNDGVNVIVDDTNLGEKHENMWREIANQYSANFEVIKMNTPIDECIKRDAVREKTVGRNVIMGMAMQYEMYKPEKGYVTVDLDGTVAEISHRLKFIRGEGKKDWKSFFEGIPGDSVREEVAEIVRKYKDEGYDIIYLSARPDNYREATEDWLKNNDLYFHKALFMRGAGDRRDDVDVKRDILNRYFPDRDLIHKVIDDRWKVVNVWKEELGEDKVIDVGPKNPDGSPIIY